MRLRDGFLKLITSESFIVGLIGFLCLREAIAALTRKDAAFGFHYDDYFYLITPIDKIGSAPFYGIEGAPIYSGWLKLLGYAFGNINALLINQALMLVLLPISLYAVLRIRRTSVFVATVVTLLFLSSSIVRSSSAIPLVSGFAIVIGLLWVVLVGKIVSRNHIYVVFMIGSFILMYIRPEYVLSLVIFAVIVVASIASVIIRILITRNNLPPRDLLLPASSLLITVLVGLWIGFPGGNGRLDFAFQQHFAVNALLFTRYNPLTTNPWDEWRTFSRASFGSASTLREAFAANPLAITAHVAMNAIRVPIALARILVDRQHPFSLWFSLGIMVVAGLAARTWLAQIFKRNRSRRSDALAWLRRTIDWPWLAALCGWMLPPLLSTIIIYPRQHYLAMVLVWATVGIVGAVRQHEEGATHALAARYLLASCVVLAVAAYPDPVTRYPSPPASQQLVAWMEHIDIPPHRIGTSHRYLALLTGYQQLDKSSLEKAQELWVLIVPRNEVEIVVKKLTEANLSFNILDIENKSYQLLVNSKFCSINLGSFVNCRN